MSSFLQLLVDLMSHSGVHAPDVGQISQPGGIAAGGAAAAAAAAGNGGWGDGHGGKQGGGGDPTGPPETFPTGYGRVYPTAPNGVTPVWNHPSGKTGGHWESQFPDGRAIEEGSDGTITGRSGGHVDWTYENGMLKVNYPGKGLLPVPGGGIGQIIRDPLTGAIIDVVPPPGTDLWSPPPPWVPPPGPRGSIDA